MTLPVPKFDLPLGAQAAVGSLSDPGKRYTIERFDETAYKCSCFAWTVHGKTYEPEVRTCKHIRELLGDEHEDVRCGPDAGRAKGKPRKKKAVDAASSSQSAPPTASGSSAAPGARPSSSRAYSTAASSPAQPTYAEPGAKKRAISLPGSDGAADKAAKGSRAKGRGKGKAKAVEFAEEDEAFEEKADEVPQPKKKKAKEREGGIDLLLAQKFDLDTRKKDPKGYWMSEKLDGVRAYWDGESALWSRVGNRYLAPKWFIDKLPQGHTLDGELFMGRDRFDETSGIVRSGASQRWHEIRFMVFDIPSLGSLPFEDRLAKLKELFPPASSDTPTSSSAAELNPQTDVGDKEGEGVVRLVEQEKCTGWDMLERRLKEVKEMGGEGLMLRQAGSVYVNKRSATLYKVKTFHDAEARVVQHEPGKGKYEGMLGALTCEMEDGKTRFSVGSGLTDARRQNPPPIGAIVTYRFQELTKAGIPRFPTFVGERHDVDGPKDAVLARTSRAAAGGGE
ncbi:hypothetical protein Rhopal_006551-T1 [Rhodotorula paludigena]|uniref:SWIM-type domain-containing protein n=1 Tax=Rhodotorula paludigena TaxID=86838 RepID=A0AAV5GU89_9BASI|nr:hypothetical protein Rhopal_006551-T1 [Rhodotorula paludigena]